MVQVRLQKLLAAAGIDSRRKCEQMILDGKVRVNKKVIDTLPAFADPEKDIILANGKRIQPEKKVYYLLNKPKGVICTNSDPQGRKKAIDIIKSDQRIFCVGRLDIDTTGLIILTNDSQLTNRLTHPKYGISKTYIAHVKGLIDAAKIEKLKKGIWLADGKTQRSAVKILKKNSKESLIQIAVKQGQNRQIRRMLAKLELPVKSLKRIKIGRITAHKLGLRNYRQLTTREIEYLKNITRT